jgi:hypothetical protein
VLVEGRQPGSGDPLIPAAAPVLAEQVAWAAEHRIWMGVSTITRSGRTDSAADLWWTWPVASSATN